MEDEIKMNGSLKKDEMNELLKLKEIKEKMNSILEYSIPIVKIWDNIILAPIIGTLDSDRTQQIMEELLNTIVKESALIAILDITGVPIIDSVTAQHIIDTVSAVHLLGSKVILTGIKPSIAQTLVHMGIILSNIKYTARSLAQGFKMALDILKLEIISKNKE